MTNNISKLKLSQAITSKLMHEFANIAGAVINSIDFIDNEKESVRGQVRDILSSESARLVRSIEVYREVYGLTGNKVSRDLSKIRDLTLQYLEIRKTEANFILPDSFDDEKLDVVRLATCLGMLAAEQCVYRGAISLTVSREQDKLVVLEGKSDKVFVKDYAEEVFKGEDIETITSSNCREYYIMQLCREAGCNLELEYDDQNVRYRIYR